MKIKHKNFFDYDYAKFRGKELKYSQRWMAEILNVRQSDLSRWLNGYRTPELYYVVLLADLLELPVQNLIKDVDE